MYGPCMVGRFDYCFAVSIVIWLMIPGVYNKDGDNRKTFIVRYTSGDLTIPVTVVLDYKKQAEYVINMNPRTPTKSVTFYDFRQKSIAYKDMSNRECFIGRLNHETIQEESERLGDIQNPLDGKPITLALDSTRSSLTPTEVRNFAGQKIAMFCRKMAAWMLQETKHRSRRQIGHRVERTYSHYGQEKHEYSRHGHETYKISYPQNEFSLHERSGKHQNPRNEISHPHSTVEHQVNGFNPYAFPLNAGDLYKGDTQIQNEFEPQVFQREISSSIPLYKPFRNSSFNTSPGKVIRNRSDFRTGSLSDYDLHNRGLLTNAIRQRENHLLPRVSHVKPLRAYNRPANIDGNGEDIVRYISPQHFQYSHQLRSGPQSHFDTLTTSSSNAIDAEADSEIKAIGVTILQKYSERNHDLHSQGISPAELKDDNSNQFGKLHSSVPNSNITFPFLVEDDLETESHSNEVLPIDKKMDKIEGEDHIIDLFLDVEEADGRKHLDNKSSIDIISHKSISHSTDIDTPEDIVNRSFNSIRFRQVPAISDHHSRFNKSDEIKNRTDGISEFPISRGTRDDSSTNDRSDIPHEDVVTFHVPFTKNETVFQPKDNIPIDKNYSLPNISIQEGVPPRQERIQNVLELFTPDEIVIDIGKLPDSTSERQTVSSFQGRFINSTFHKTLKNETRTRQRTNQHIPVQGRRKSYNSEDRVFSGQHTIGRIIPQKRIQTQTALQPPAMLPPGVSIYPRHPNAPYAQLVPPSSKRTAVPFNNPRISIHHQRHHRKKIRKMPSCCNQELGKRPECCERGQCCSTRRHRGQMRTSCCKSTKLAKPISPVPASRVIHNVQKHKNDSNTKDLCDIKKMCRTLYQSTQAVKVCKINNVPGC